MNKEEIKKLLAMVGEVNVEVKCYPQRAKEILWEMEGRLQEYLVCLLESDLLFAKERLTFIQQGRKVEKKDE